MAQRRRFHFDELRAARAGRFAAKLADILHALGMTHKELAQALGVTHHAVDSWTRGVDPTIPGEPNYARLCSLLEARQPGAGRELAAAGGHPWKPPAPADPRPDTAPAAPGDAAVPTNLLVPLSSFVGRTHETAEVTRLLTGDPGASRLLTLTGVGGIGKTRLALQVAATLGAHFPHGIWLVELAPLRDPALVPQVVAAVLGVREQGSTPLLDLIADYLRRRQVLLVLDNCEHLIDACAVLVTRLLSAAPGLQVLATSREALRVTGEVAWRVPSLSLPHPLDLPPLDRLGDYEAPRLFLERARLAQPGFPPTPQHAAAVSHVCRRLDGVPLAIELAAACLRVLTVEQIAARLDDRFRLLTDGGRDVLPRHRTLRAAIEWSYELLPDQERALFLRLAVFAGGWTLEAAEAVGSGQNGVDATNYALGIRPYAADPHSSFLIPHSSVLGLLKQLVDKSLVLVEEGDGAARYRMLETIRAYGLEQLAASGDEAAVRHCHAAYYLAFAETADTQMHGPQQPVALDRLEREYDNLRTALRWAVDAGEQALALRFGRALTLFWFFHGHFSEGRRWLDTMLQAEDPALADLRAWALNGAGVLACFQGDFAHASGLFARSMELARAIGDRESVAFSLTSLSGAALYQNAVDRAVALAEESLAMFRGLGNKWNIGVWITNLIPALLGQGRLDDAMQLAEERLGLYEDLGNPWGIATSYTNLGLAASAQGDHAQAEAFYREGLAHFAALNDKWGSYECLAGLAGTVAAQDQPEQAARLCGLTDALREALGAIAPPAFYRYDQVVAAVRARLGEAAWEAAWNAGRNLPLDSLLA